MKRSILFIVFALIIGKAWAQVENLDEVEIMGEWNVVDGDGIFTGRLPIYHNTYKKPMSFTFKDNDYTIVGWEYADGNPSYSKYAGYWITHNSERYILHILCDDDYDIGSPNMSLLNFIITQYSGSTMTLQTLSGDSNLYLNKNTASNIETVKTQVPENNKIYTINGVEVSEPVKGINIKNGKKFIKK